MKKRDLIQLMVGLSYSTGYDHAKQEQEKEHWHELALLRNYQDGVKSERERIVKQLGEDLHLLLENHGLVLIQEEFDSLISQLTKGEN